MEINVIDMGDELLGMHESQLRQWNKRVIKLYGMCDGVGQMVAEVIKAAGCRGVITVLRIYSHAAPGGVNVSAGKDDHDEDWAGIGMANLKDLESTLGLLKPYFASPQARVELHGCEVAEGKEGEKLMMELARIWQVRVHAATERQNMRSVNWVGPVFEATPGGGLCCINGIPVSKAGE